MNATKAPLQSITVNAAAGSAVVSLLTAFGIDLGPDGATYINALVAGGLAIVAIWGRIRATRRIVRGG
ncbi:hypothetical protein HY78_00535 [Rhizorhabdus wittichii DC-6]|nr:hypothetical protein HY78_00535 [Rhizorhabdus wittichii DC-6]